MKLIEMTMRVIAQTLFLLYWHIALEQAKTEYVFKNRERVQMMGIFVSLIAAGIVAFINYFFLCNSMIYELYLFLCGADTFILVVGLFSKWKGWHGDFKNKSYFSYDGNATAKMKTDTQIDFSLPTIHSSEKVYQIENRLFVGQIDFDKGQSVVIEANPLDEERQIYAIEGILDKGKRISIYDVLMYIHLINLDVGLISADQDNIVLGYGVGEFVGLSIVMIAILFTVRLFKKQEKMNIASRIFLIFSLTIYILIWILEILNVLEYFL